jgi:glutathione S-transferase
MQHRHLFVGSVLAGVEGAANSIFKIIAPGVAFLMRRGMNINAESAERSLGYVRESFAEVSELLSDGRTHLVGTQLTAADLTFAALAAPMVLPEDYGSPLPSMGELPDELRELVAGFRETPAGEFVLGIYEEYR